MEYNKDDLAFYQQRVSTKNRLKSKLKERQEQREVLIDKVDELSKVLFKEQKDVKRLEKISVESLFYSAIGMKDKRLDKEKQEEVAAAFKYNMAREELRVVDDDIYTMRRELAKLNDAEALCKEAFDTKVKFIKDNNIAGADTLVSLESKIIFFQSQQKELKEAIDAGREVLCAIERVKDRLKEADGYAVLDMVGFMDTLSWAAKHESLHEAEEYMTDLEKKIKIFQRELRDVNMTFEAKQLKRKLSGFTDLIFDSIIFDAISRNKIGSSKSDLKKMYTQVLGIVNDLKQNHMAISEKNKELQNQYEQIIFSI